MYLMRLGPVGSERPVVRIDDSHYLDVSDVVDDFDEAFFGSNGLTRLAEVVRERSTTEQLQEFGERADRSPDRTPTPDSVHRVELQRPRRGNRCGSSRRADPFHQVAQLPRRPER